MKPVRSITRHEWKQDLRAVYTVYWLNAMSGMVLLITDKYIPFTDAPFHPFVSHTVVVSVLGVDTTVPKRPTSLMNVICVQVSGETFP